MIRIRFLDNWHRRRAAEKRRRAEQDDLLERTSREIEDLVDRAERVRTQLRARQSRNHWGEAIAQIARKEHLT